jgi:hypothetical protein
LMQLKNLNRLTPEQREAIARRLKHIVLNYMPNKKPPKPEGLEGSESQSD